MFAFKIVISNAKLDIFQSKCFPLNRDPTFQWPHAVMMNINVGDKL